MVTCSISTLFLTEARNLYYYDCYYYSYFLHVIAIVCVGLVTSTLLTYTEEAVY